MSREHRSHTLLVLAAYAAVAVGTGCAGRVTYRTYDPAYSDYHVWDNNERGYYNQWVIETHRSNRDFRKLDKNDQDAYWKWRHENHPDHR